MTFLINTYTPEGSQKPSYFFRELIQHIISIHSEHRFAVLANEEWYFLKPFANVNWLPTEELNKSSILSRFLFSNKMSKLIKEVNPDVIIHACMYGIKNEIPQVMVAPDWYFLTDPSRFSKSVLKECLHKNSGFISHNKKVIVTSDFDKEAISKYASTSTPQLQVVPFGLPKSLPEVSFERKQELKEVYCDGNEFFLYHGPIGTHYNLINLLKSFSGFKKRLRSKMHLLISGFEEEGFEMFKSELSHYKFRNEVKILLNDDELVYNELISSAYAIISPAIECNVDTAIRAMYYRVPVLTTSPSPVAELCGDASIIFEKNDIRDLALKMIGIFKDENLRRHLGNESQSLLPSLWKVSAEKTWKSLIEKL